MALTKRITHLLTADAHAVLDLIEDPHTMLKQALRDMNIVIHRQQAELKSLFDQRVKLTRMDQDIVKSNKQIEQDLDLCIAENNSDLARSLVKKKLYLNRQQSQIEQSQQTLTCSIESCQSQLRDNQSKQESIRLKADVVKTQILDRVSDSHQEFDLGLITDDEIEVALLREMQTRSTK